MRILAIDPATKCGWCYYDTETLEMHSGVWDLKPSRHESASMKFIKIKSSLQSLLQTMPADILSYEEVRRHMSTDAAHSYGGLIAMIQIVCEESNLPYTTVTVQDVKRIATGKGGGKGTDKKAIMEKAQEVWPDVVFASDDEADARFIALATERELHAKKGKA